MGWGSEGWGVEGEGGEWMAPTLWTVAPGGPVFDNCAFWRSPLGWGSKGWGVEGMRGEYSLDDVCIRKITGFVLRCNAPHQLFLAFGGLLRDPIGRTKYR